MYDCDRRRYARSLDRAGEFLKFHGYPAAPHMYPKFVGNSLTRFFATVYFDP